MSNHHCQIWRKSFGVVLSCLWMERFMFLVEMIPTIFMNPVRCLIWLQTNGIQFRIWRKLDGVLRHVPLVINCTNLVVKLIKMKDISLQLRCLIQCHKNGHIFQVWQINDIHRCAAVSIKNKIYVYGFQKMITFWNYFQKYWMSSERFIKTWNINDYHGNENLLKHTNNWLESYNKRLKSLFCSGTPSFTDFVNMMRGESAYQQKKIQDHMGKSTMKEKNDEDDDNFIYEMPPCYAGWVPPSSIDNWIKLNFKKIGI